MLSLSGRAVPVFENLGWSRMIKSKHNKEGNTIRDNEHQWANRSPWNVSIWTVRLQWRSFQELGSQFQYGPRKAQCVISWVTWVMRLCSAWRTTLYPMFIQIHSPCSNHANSLTTSIHVLRFTYIYTYTHCYIAVSNITMLFILEATARAIHQGSIRHTCRLSLEQLVCKFSTLIPDPFHIDNSDTLMFPWFFLIIFMWLKLHEIAAFDHVMARN